MGKPHLQFVIIHQTRQRVNEATRWKTSSISSQQLRTAHATNGNQWIPAPPARHWTFSGSQRIPPAVGSQRIAAPSGRSWTSSGSQRIPLAAGNQQIPAPPARSWTSSGSQRISLAAGNQRTPAPPAGSGQPVDPSAAHAQSATSEQ